jgi:UTP--glucose-1-phosphate uridylyltransferase
VKTVLTVAGLGTRLLPLTKELPKEMLPIFVKAKNGELLMKPILQVIFETLYDHKIRDYCFIVGKTKRAVEEHFTPDFDMVQYLKDNKKSKLSKMLDTYSKKLEKSNIVFIYQPKPIGFGDAIEKSKTFVNGDDFLLHAGDDVVISKRNDHLTRLEKAFKKYDADIACLVEEVDDPKKYGVVNGTFLENGVMKITEMKEKPKNPSTKFAIIAIYIFKSSIFNKLSDVKIKGNPEKQLAYAFNMAIKKNENVIGVFLKKSEKRIDIGTPESYLQVLTSSKTIKIE